MNCFEILLTQLVQESVSGIMGKGGNVDTGVVGHFHNEPGSRNQGIQGSQAKCEKGSGCRNRLFPARLAVL